MKKNSVIRQSLTRIDWKAEFGYAVQIGLDGAIEELNQIAGWMAERFDQETILIDDCKGDGKESILSGLKADVGTHYRVPPTINGKVKLYTEAPELHFPVHFLSVPTDAREGLDAVAKRIRKGSVIYGSPTACADVLEVAELAAQPLLYHGDVIAVRAA